MQFLNYSKVLCLSPHPDDVELGLSGTVIKYNKTHFNILTLSSGGNYEGTKASIREAELKKAWQSININNVSINIDTLLGPKKHTEDFLINKIENHYMDDCQAIFVPTYIDSHFEHRITNQLATSLTRCKNISVIEYRTPSTLNNWSPNMYIDITDVYQQKIFMLRNFESQKTKEYFKPNALNAFHTDFQSIKKGNTFVEQFKLIQLYGH